MTDDEHKIVIVGSGGVGKSALVIRFIQEKFPDIFSPTIEETYQKDININGNTVTLDIVDTAGQDEYSILREQFLRSGEGFIIVYSTTDPGSFEDIEKYYELIQRFCPYEKPPLLIVGNKTDLKEDRAVTFEEGKEAAEKFEAAFMETSSKENVNIEQPFFQIARTISLWKEEGHCILPDDEISSSGRKKKACIIM